MAAQPLHDHDPDDHAHVQFHSLSKPAQDALVRRAVELAEKPWDGVEMLPPGDDPAFRETVFDSGTGMLSFHISGEAALIRIHAIVWIG